MYGSGNPLVQSVTELRTALTEEVARRDPAGTNAALRQMVLVGHSQGGLLVKGTVIDSGDRLLRLLSTNRIEALPIEEAQRQEIRSRLCIEPLPFVRRVIFIATPHRGSYLASGFARKWAKRMVSLPRALVLSQRGLAGLHRRLGAGQLPQRQDADKPRRNVAGKPRSQSHRRSARVPGHPRPFDHRGSRRRRLPAWPGRSGDVPKRSSGGGRIGVGGSVVSQLPEAARHHPGSAPDPAGTSSELIDPKDSRRFSRGPSGGLWPRPISHRVRSDCRHRRRPADAREASSGCNDGQKRPRPRAWVEYPLVPDSASWSGDTGRNRLLGFARPKARFWSNARRFITTLLPTKPSRIRWLNSFHRVEENRSQSPYMS